MAAGGGQERSDAELRIAVINGWEGLKKRVKSSPDPLVALAQRTGMSFRQLDMVRHVRGSCAHADPVPQDRLLAALQVIADAEQRLQTHEPATDHSQRQPHRLTRRPPDQRQPSVPKPKPIPRGQATRRTSARRVAGREPEDNPARRKDGPTWRPYPGLPDPSSVTPKARPTPPPREAPVVAVVLIVALMIVAMFLIVRVFLPS